MGGQAFNVGNNGGQWGAMGGDMWGRGGSDGGAATPNPPPRRPLTPRPPPADLHRAKPQRRPGVAVPLRPDLPALQGARQPGGIHGGVPAGRRSGVRGHGVSRGQGSKVGGGQGGVGVRSPAAWGTSWRSSCGVMSVGSGVTGSRGQQGSPRVRGHGVMGSRVTGRGVRGSLGSLGSQVIGVR